jgi:hypothetical protein
VVTPTGEGGGGAAAELDDGEGADNDGGGNEGAGNEKAGDIGAGEVESSVDGSDPNIEGLGMVGAAGAATAGGAAAACHRMGAPVGGMTEAVGVSKMPCLNRNNSSSKETCREVITQ